MILPERFILTIEGKLWNVRRRANIVPNELPHKLAYLLTGADVDLSAFEANGLRITIEEDTDQGRDCLGLAALLASASPPFPNPPLGR